MNDNTETVLKFEVPEIIYGVGSLSVIGNCAARLGGDRVLLVTDPGIVNAGWIDETVKHIERENLKYVVYDNVVSNPRDFQVEQGVQLYRQNRCDVIVAVGGGSPIDAAKGIAWGLKTVGRYYPDLVYDWLRKMENKGLPRRALVPRKAMLYLPDEYKIKIKI